MDELVKRVRRAAESILENEALTADLDDAAAKALLDWGIASAELIARSTAGLGDLEAEEVTTPRHRATRRLMRLVNRWVAGWRELDAGGSGALLDRIIEQAAIIHGEGFQPPGAERRAAFLERGLALGGCPEQLVVDLRRLIERPEEECEAGSGGGDGQKTQHQEIIEEDENEQVDHKEAEQTGCVPGRTRTDEPGPGHGGDGGRRGPAGVLPADGVRSDGAVQPR